MFHVSLHIRRPAWAVPGQGGFQSKDCELELKEGARRPVWLEGAPERVGSTA